MLGELLFPLGQPFFHPITGLLVPNGKLSFTRTGTTTDQDTYSDSAITTPNANPVILSSIGILETKVYGDPSTGYNYRVRLYDSADVLLWTYDDVVLAETTDITADSLVVNSVALTPAYTTFTPKISGTSTAGVGTYTSQVGRYFKIGKLVYFSATVAWTAHTGTGSLTLTSLPFASLSGSSVYVVNAALENVTYSNDVVAIIGANTTSMTLYSQSTGGALSGIAIDTTGTLHASGWYLTT